MRLINTSTLKLEEFGPQNVPPYAILSHRWIEGQEVSFEEMRGSPPQEKSGYAKIKHCCELAKKEGLTFAWIDTCCIDKSSSAELSESINSMFRWYAMAQVCYAYLEDVPYLSSSSSFRESAWFTRGWTLQELLSPSRLKFYSAEWELIGDRFELSDGVSYITGIEQQILQGHFHHQGVLNLSSVSIAERMSWASQRQTSREEDMSYSLLGIFCINMNLLYGEGGKEAFRRLQEEIIKTSNDNSIFAWNQIETRSPARLSALATTLSQFAYSYMIPVLPAGPTSPTTLTNEAINVLLTFREIRGRRYGILKDYSPHSLWDYAIPLEEISPNTYVRLLGQVLVMKSRRFWGTPVYTSLVNRLGKHGEVSSRTDYIYSAIMFRNLPSSFKLFMMEVDGRTMTWILQNRLYHVKGPTWVKASVDRSGSRAWIFCIHPGLAGAELKQLWREEWVYSSNGGESLKSVKEIGREMAERPIYHQRESKDDLRVRVEALMVAQDIPRLVVDVREWSAGSSFEILLDAKHVIERVVHDISQACRNYSVVVATTSLLQIISLALHMLFFFFLCCGIFLVGSLSLVTYAIKQARRNKG